MSQAGNHHKINYIEFAALDLARAKQFYATVFGWSFQDWGSEYISFDAADAGIAGGFRQGKPDESAGDAAPLVVFYSADLKATEGGDCCGQWHDRRADLRVSWWKAIPLRRRRGGSAGSVVGVRRRFVSCGARQKSTEALTLQVCIEDY
jgi:catechol 2,3-dioxygenase-like lactoylglutathione lyase family enzyme